MNPACTALADQLDAATAAVQQSMDRMVTEIGYLPGTTREDPWLLALLVDAVSDTCEHVAAMRAPQPVFVSAHLRRVQCEACQRAEAAAMAGTPEDETCDRCRAVQPGGLLTTLAAAFGPVCVPMGLCEACLPAIRGGHR